MKVEDRTMDAIAVLMNTELREKVHFEIAPCSNEEFLKRYCELAPQFKSVLKSEFGIELQKGCAMKDLTGKRFGKLMVLKDLGYLCKTAERIESYLGDCNGTIDI